MQELSLSLHISIENTNLVKHNKTKTISNIVAVSLIIIGKFQKKIAKRIQILVMSCFIALIDLLPDIRSKKIDQPFKKQVHL